jgi:hypothetical protein
VVAGWKLLYGAPLKKGKEVISILTAVRESEKSNAATVLDKSAVELDLIS